MSYPTTIGTKTPIRQRDEGQHIELTTSELCPINIPAGEKLRAWKPKTPYNMLDDNRQPTNINQEDLARIQQVLEDTFVPNTRNTYGTRLFAFYLFCNTKGVDEDHQALADPTVLASFIATLIETYGASNVRNYVLGALYMGYNGK